uniref:Putative endonuclease n=1 Tax=Ixodes ricinus TaxID=34613 RepID=A0A0K8RF06_IXORI
MWHIDRILVALLILLEIVYSAGAKRKHNVYCKNNNAEDVDWYVIYKLPKTKEIKHPPSYYINPKGDEIAYFDSDMAKNKKTPLWRESKPGIYDVHNPVAYTLMPLLAKTIPRDIAYVTYNDQVPEGFYGTRGGHSKGVLMVGHSTSVWLQHSVPRFPEMLHEGKYIYPPSGRENAQLFLCLTVPTMSMVEVIAYHLRVQYANVYQRHFAWIREDNYPQLFMLLNYIYVTGSTSLANHTMITERKQLIQSIAKRSIWKHDIYRDIVAPYMVKGDLLVESWRNGAGGTVDKSCAYYSVIDVKTVRIQFESGMYTVFNYTEDHSKWAVAAYKPFFCFSSLNRMMSQFNRGGEVTCMQNKNLADLFRNSIVDEDACTSSKGKQKSRKS